MLGLQNSRQTFNRIYVRLVANNCYSTNSGFMYCTCVRDSQTLQFKKFEDVPSRELCGFFRLIMVRDFKGTSQNGDSLSTKLWKFSKTYNDSSLQRSAFKFFVIKYFDHTCDELLMMWSFEWRFSFQPSFIQSNINMKNALHSESILNFVAPAIQKFECT